MAPGRSPLQAHSGSVIAEVLVSLLQSARQNKASMLVMVEVY